MILQYLLFKKNRLFIILLLLAHHNPPSLLAKWNFMVYMAANNNLYRYGLKNIKQMEQIGSNKNISIFVQLDNFGKKEVSYYKIEKGKKTVLKTIQTPPESISGTPESLFHFVKETIINNPATHNALILWNHGSGIKDPSVWTRNFLSQREEYFSFNQETSLYEINKQLYQNQIVTPSLFPQEQKNPYLGIAFNDVAHTYLTNQDLKVALEKIKNEVLQGKKFDIIATDACHMSMAEICTQIKNSAHYFVGSQEIEPGDGWKYEYVLTPFLSHPLTPPAFATHMVSAYASAYNHSFADLTHSAINIDAYLALEKNINTIATHLLTIIKSPHKNNFFNLLSKTRQTTTKFLDAEYLDLGHFFKLLATNISTITPHKSLQATFKELKAFLAEGTALLSSCIIKNATGRNAKKACGLSIYFPLKAIHPSYHKTDFALQTNWHNFLLSYLQKIRRCNESPDAPTLSG